MTRFGTWLVALLFLFSISVVRATPSETSCQKGCEAKYGPAIDETNSKLRELLRMIGESTDETTRSSLRQQHLTVTQQLDLVQSEKLHCVLACFK